MIKYTTGNIFNSDADCIFNTVNCEGYMGKGIAYQFKQRFPENNKNYERICKEGELRPGVILPFVENGKMIINFPTKDKWRNPSRIQYVIDGLDSFVSLLPDLNIKKVAIPPLGCGNGGLRWNEVKPIIERKLMDCDIEIEVFEPYAIKVNTTLGEQMTVYDLLILHVRGKLKKVNSLRFQKTLFFTNYYANTKIYGFARGRYGPYSKDLYWESEKIRRFQKLNALANTEDTYKSIYQMICSKKTDNQYNKISAYIDKALELVNSIEDDLILEGIATALYLIKDENMTNKTSVVHAFREWSDDKAARFSEKTIMICLDKLECLGIIRRNLFEEYEVLKS
ncbi:MAG: macro domain-containing protein [Lachnospiraceae bacterium]|nr:macro domain-containing protein [Lachnospiraceae bacterium]